jgi:hypothetical protein
VCAGDVDTPDGMILTLNFIKTDQKLLYHTHTDDPLHALIISGNAVESREVERLDAEHTPKVVSGTQ